MELFNDETKMLLCTESNIIQILDFPSLKVNNKLTMRDVVISVNIN